MTIRSKLLQMLLPPLIAFVALISLFFYYHWYQEILASFKANLKTVVISTAQNIKPEEISWLESHSHDTAITDEPIYKHYHDALYHIKKALPITSLYLVKIGEGADSQLFLLDASNPIGYVNGETGAPPLPAHFNFFTGGGVKGVRGKVKEAYVTPVYESKATHERMMTAYAPITDESGSVVALVGADMNLHLIDKNLQNALFSIAAGALTAICLVALSVWIVAGKISRPVQKLKDNALAIAAGSYGNTVDVHGPLEIVELANTLNTMSECLQENINRVKENASARLRLFGEYECALLLQHQMFGKVVDDFHDNALVVKAIKETAETTSRGIFFNIVKSDSKRYEVLFSQAKQKGFSGLYHLLMDAASERPKCPRIHLSIDLDSKVIENLCHNLPAPVVWSSEQKKLLQLKEPFYKWRGGGLLFLYNSGLVDLFDDEQEVIRWLHKVLRHFAAEELDLFLSMLQSELIYLTQKQAVQEDVYMLCFVIK